MNQKTASAPAAENGNHADWQTLVQHVLTDDGFHASAGTL